MEAPRRLVLYPPERETDRPKPKTLPRGIKRPKFQSREDVVRYAEMLAASVVKPNGLEVRLVRPLISAANLALGAWALELAGKTASAMQPVKVEMIDYRSLLPKPANGGDRQHVDDLTPSTAPVAPRDRGHW